MKPYIPNTQNLSNQQSFIQQNNNFAQQMQANSNYQYRPYFAQQSHSNNLNSSETSMASFTINMQPPQMFNLNTNYKPPQSSGHHFYNPTQFTLEGTYQIECNFENANQSIQESLPGQQSSQELMNPPTYDSGVKKKEIRKSNSLRMGINEYELNFEQMAAATMHQSKRMGRLSTLEQREKRDDQIKEQLRIDIENTISRAIQNSTNRQMYIFKEQNHYHKTKCCCDIYYIDDCCCKQIFDTLFFGLCCWIRTLLCVMRICCFGKEKRESDCCCRCCLENCNDCLYAPFQVIGDWFNQCCYSFSNFCCDRNLNFLPSMVTNVFDSCCMRFCMSIGQFCKNCCLFPLNSYGVCKPCCTNQNGDCCLTCFCQSFGNCCQHCCAPQGCCENMCSGLSNCLGCMCSPSTIVEKCCCCCSEKSSLVVEGQVVGEIFKCCGCVISTVGEFVAQFIGVLGSVFK